MPTSDSNKRAPSEAKMPVVAVMIRDAGYEVQNVETRGGQIAQAVGEQNNESDVESFSDLLLPTSIFHPHCEVSFDGLD